MKDSARRQQLAVGAVILVMLGMPAVVHAKRPAAGHTARLNFKPNDCPCASNPFFASFFDGQRQLLACTDDTPYADFVRLVDVNVDLVVLFEFPPLRFCGWQAVGGHTAWLPVTAPQFDSCKRLMVWAAAEQGMPCLREPETAP